MLNDILNFAVRSLVTNGRLAMWMPTANDEEVELAVPMHPNLEGLVDSSPIEDYQKDRSRMFPKAGKNWMLRECTQTN
ncbi:RNA methylase family protein [Aspergillus luchuensis]|uniref:RNA methylase family protein n=1 Tax=Aspergillus kawachii TaxID=1069201 RepID=A0A146FPQ4_ASPKA|nr:RNA methylase family protein [Aspergillus luchuensis]